MDDVLKKELLHVIANSNAIKDKLTFKEQLYLYRGVSNFSDSQITNLYVKLHEKVEPPKPHPKIQKYLSVGLYIACTAVPIPLLSDLVYYLVNRHSFTCLVRCQQAEQEINKGICYAKCKLGSYKWAVRMIQNEIKKCDRHKEAKKQKKCRKSLFKLLITWRKKVVEAEIKLGTSIRAAKAGVVSKRGLKSWTGR